MTGQIPDKVYYEAREYSLIGAGGGPLFDPTEYGIEPCKPHTACYRGYIATYSLDDDGRFTLEELRVWTEKILWRIGSDEAEGGLPPINGVRPFLCGEYSYLRLRIPFTGVIRLAKDFSEECYVHQGFQKASAYETVLDVKLKKGRLVEVKDRSKEAARRRGEFRKRYMEDGDVVKAVDEAFDLDLDLW